MVRFGQPVLDAVGMTKHVEHVGAPARCRPETVLRQIGELDSVVGERGADCVGDGFNQGFEEVRSYPTIGLLVQFGVGELGCPIDGDEVADGIGLELLPSGFVARGLRQTADPMPLEAAVQG
jgi:hypothetical protein